MLAGMMPWRRNRLTRLPNTSRTSALSSSCVGMVSVSIRSEAPQSSQQHYRAGAEAGGQHVDVADRKWIWHGERGADDLAKAGREQAQQGIPRDPGEMAADEHEARGGIDDAEQAGQDEPWRQGAQREGHVRCRRMERHVAWTSMRPEFA